MAHARLVAKASPDTAKPIALPARRRPGANDAQKGG